MKYTRNWLIATATEQTEYLLFWGHKPSVDGSITKSCFSQWWESPFIVEGRTYPTAEHWMMAGKAQLFGDYDILEEIFKTESPAKAKALGRHVRNFDHGVWSEKCGEIVVQGNFYKFSQHPQLKHFLLATGHKIIVEASPVDRIWGIGLAQDSPNATQPHNWKGENLLGFALMEVRDILTGLM
jgi:ribA/ribD-fused uncharacterized protein